jgi:hypothetical protein
VSRVLADLIDAQGHRVTATEDGDLLTIVTQPVATKTPKWIAPGHPCLTRDTDQAVKLRDALNEFIDGAGATQVTG